jgi:hypothetical protein
MVNKNNTLEVLKKNIKKKYAKTKALSIEYTRKLLEDDEKSLEILELYDKKDDLCDAFLQNIYYFNHIRKNNKKKEHVAVRKNQNIISL